MIFSPYEEALLLNNFYLTINAMDDFASSASRLMYVSGVTNTTNCVSDKSSGA